MKIAPIAVSMVILASLSLCGCESGQNDTISAVNNGSQITVNDEDSQLLDEMQDDIQTVDPEDFAETAATFSADTAGQVYQLVGYYQTADSDEGTADYLCSADGEASVLLRYLSTELTEGDSYTVTGIVAVESHGTHSHIYFDVVTVESYTSE